MFLEKAYTGKNQWYLYLFTTLLVFLGIQVAGLPLGLYLLIQNPEAAMQGTISTATSTNLGFALTLLTFAGGFITLFLCVKYIHKKRYLDIVTARTRFDWKRFGFAIGLWSLFTFLSLGWSVWNAEPGQLICQFEPAKFFWLIVIALLLFPFQTSFEELFFRGYLMQGVGLLFKYRWIPFVVTSVLFGLLHGANPEVAAFGLGKALPLYIIMGLIMGYLAIKDNGLELALGLHLANNFWSALLVTSDSSALQTHALFRDTAPTLSYLDSVWMLLTGILFIYCCNLKYKFFHLNRLSEKIKPENENNF